MVNLLVICLNHFVKKKHTTITFQHLELPNKMFWVEAVNTYCYVLNHVTLRPKLKKISYELWRWRKPNILYFKVFYSKCFILNIKDNLDKFDLKSNLGIFLGFSSSSKAYRVYNNTTLCLKESIHIAFQETQNDKLLRF